MNLRLVCACLAACFACTEIRGQEQPASPVVPGGRTTVTISANWRFQLDVSDLGDKEQWQRPAFDRSSWTRVNVPKAWDLYDEALWGYEGIGWYSTQIDRRLARTDQVQRLKFGRVNYHSKVWLNGEFLGENLNGYLPFEFDVTGKLKRDAPNLLVLRVDNRPRLTWLPAAKQIEWIQYGGILQPISLETTAQVYISGLTIDAKPEGRGASISCAVEVTSPPATAGEFRLRLAVSGQPQATKSVTLQASEGGKSIAKIALALEQASLWSPDHPFLYSLVATIRTDKSSDTVTSPFGVRKIETRGRQILLNGQPFRAKGVNRYDEYGKFGPNPPRKLLIEDLRRMKNAGVNFVRVHYPQSPEIISLYDEMGLVMSEEVPLNWWGNNFSGKGEEVQSEEILQQAMPALEAMVQRDKNHPAVIIWSMCNESQTANEAGISVMRKLIRRAKELDPTRLVTFVTAPGEVKDHKAFEDADLVATNMYAGQFGRHVAHHIGELGELVTAASKEYLRRQLAAFPDKPLLVTEYGSRGVPGIHGDIDYSEDFQAEFIQAAWKAIQDDEEVSGGVLWCWADYYHRRALIQYAVFGPYGAVTVDRRPKAALRALAKMYGGRVIEPEIREQPAQP
jgi:beta-glucuronidase